MQHRFHLITVALACLLSACAVNLNINDHQLLGSEISQEDDIRALFKSRPDGHPQLRAA